MGDRGGRSHLAIEAAVRFGAERIYLVGVDLAYPKRVSHAEGLMDRTERKNTEDMLLCVERSRQLAGVCGYDVYPVQKMDRKIK